LENKNKPLITIVVPVYRSQAFLNQCVDSLLNQTLKSIEIILVNDGSPDNSGLICDEYARKDDRIVVIHQKNKGAADALNQGTYKASAPFLMYVDADDWLEDNTCQISFDTMEQYNADVVFWSYYRESQLASTKDVPIFTKDTFFDESSIKDLYRRIVGLLGEEIRNPIRTDAISAGWGRLYRRELITKNNIKWTDTQLVGSSDVLFSIHVFQHVKRAYFLNKHLNHYRTYNPSSLTKNYGFSLHGKFLNLFKLIKDHIEKYNLGNDFKQALNNRICLSLINNTLGIVGVKNETSVSEKIERIKLILNDPTYRDAIYNFNTKHLSFHWWIFFLIAKWRFSLGIYFLGIIMRRLR